MNTKLVIGTIVGVSILIIGVITGLGIYLTSGPVEVTKTVANEPVANAPKQEVGDTQVTLPSDKYEDIYAGAKNEFMSGCLGEDASQSECSCMYEHLDSHLTNDEFTEYVNTITEDDLGDAGWDAVRACYGR